MFELPSGLGVIQSWGVSGKFELLHYLLRASVFSFEQQCQVDIEFNELPRLVLIARRRRRGAKKRLETVARLRVLFFLKRDLGEIVLGFRHFWVEFCDLFEGRFRAIEVLLRE